MTESPEAAITYFSWEGDACRLLEYPNGDTTADLYRGGKGLLPIQVSDVLFGAKEITEEAYKELVLEEIALSKREGSGG